MDMQGTEATVEEKIRHMRIGVDLVAKTIKLLPGSPELTKAHNSAMLGRAWLGKMLGAMGTPSPYPNDGTRKTVKDIEPAADKAAAVEIKLNGQDSVIEHVDKLRQAIGETIKQVEGFSSQSGRKADVMKENVYTHLCEARFWLGFELERIKNYHDGKEG